MIAILQFILDGFGSIASGLLSVLPDSPFKWVFDADRSFLGYMNFAFPVSAVVAELALYVTCVLTYYGIRVVMRWVKVASA